jgi:phage-related tail fiber protein
MSDKDVEAAAFKALRKLVTDPTAQEKFKRQFKHSVAEYIGALLSDEDSQDIIKSAAIIDDNDDDVEEDDIQVVAEHITRRITVKIESSENLQKKKASTVASVLEKVRESALSSSKSSDKTVKNKAAASEDSAPAKDFSARKADDHEDSSSFEDEQL